MDFPDEVLVLILCRLQLNDLWAAALVSRQWHHVRWLAHPILKLSYKSEDAADMEQQLRNKLIYMARHSYFIERLVVEIVHMRYESRFRFDTSWINFVPQSVKDLQLDAKYWDMNLWENVVQCEQLSRLVISGERLATSVADLHKLRAPVDFSRLSGLKECRLTCPVGGCTDGLMTGAMVENLVETCRTLCTLALHRFVDRKVTVLHVTSSSLEEFAISTLQPRPLICLEAPNLVAFHVNNARVEVQAAGGRLRQVHYGWNSDVQFADMRQLANLVHVTTYGVRGVVPILQVAAPSVRSLDFKVLDDITEFHSQSRAGRERSSSKLGLEDLLLTNMSSLESICIHPRSLKFGARFNNQIGLILPSLRSLRTVKYEVQFEGRFEAWSQCYEWLLAKAFAEHCPWLDCFEIDMLGKAMDTRDQKAFANYDFVRIVNIGAA